MNNLAPMKNCPGWGGGVLGNLNWMRGCSEYAEIEESESIIGDILQLQFTYIRLRFELVFYLAVTG